MKPKLPVFALIFLLLIPITGCSVARFTETRLGYGVKTANKTDLDLDFQLGFNAIDRSFRVTLAHQPYSIHKPRITRIDLGVGVAALGLLGKVLYDNWDHEDTFTFGDDTFDWYGSEPWEKAVMIGVPVDLLLYWGFAYPFDRRAVRLERQPLVDHPYRIQLPDHGNIGIDYRTTTGDEKIYVQTFINALRNPTYLQQLESLQFEVATRTSGSQHSRYHTLKGFIVSESQPSPSHPNGLAHPNGSTQPVEVDAEWRKRRLPAGEKATLKVVVKNTSTTVLSGVTATTDSAAPDFGEWTLTFGDIAPGASKTRVLRCSTESASKTVFVTLRFAAATGDVLAEIQTQLELIE